MKIAVPVHNGFVNEHFGHSENFIIYTISPEKKVESVIPVPSLEGCGCKSGISEILAKHGVSIMLAGNISAGAIHNLNVSGIDVVRGCQGPADLAVRDYLGGEITDREQTCEGHGSCDHH
jgi:predicted Fe-Mo cluster-binding NifX family protein